MSRTLKNIIMIIMLVVTLLLTAVTVYKATDERIVVSDGIGAGGDPNGMGGEGDPGGLAGDMGGTMNEDGSVTTPEGITFYPDGTATKADGTPLTQDEINSMMPTPPDGEAGMGMPDGGAGMEIPTGGNGESPIAEADINDLDKMYYVYLGVENLIFVLILAYLILSGFNKKEFNETFNDKIKFILLAIIAVFGTAIFTYTCNFISDILAEKLAEKAEEESKSTQTTNPAESTTTPEVNQTEENIETEIANPDEGIITDQNQNMESVPDMQVQPNENTNVEDIPDGTENINTEGQILESGEMAPQMP